ncbi:MAG TPA: hypothetical protein VFD38_11410 [Myxococcaceae bacterium]|nr:hypothetical protein [Myxococcaceae bacterium]
MSIWSNLLSLHGHLTHVREAHNDDAEAERTAADRRAEAAEHLREVIGCRSSGSHPEPRGPLLGVRGLT